MRKLTQLHYAIKYSTHPSFNFTYTHRLSNCGQNPNSLSMTRILNCAKHEPTIKHHKFHFIQSYEIEYDEEKIGIGGHCKTSTSRFQISFLKEPIRKT